MGFKASFSFPFLVLLCPVSHVAISFPGGVLQDEDKKQLILGSCLSSHFPSEKKKKLLRSEFLSEPLFGGLENRNALGSQAGNFKRNPA